jgi:hypothetical protein
MVESVGGLRIRLMDKLGMRAIALTFCVFDPWQHSRASQTRVQFFRVEGNWNTKFSAIVPRASRPNSRVRQRYGRLRARSFSLLVIHLPAAASQLLRKSSQGPWFDRPRELNSQCAPRDTRVTNVRFRVAHPQSCARRASCRLAR